MMTTSGNNMSSCSSGGGSSSSSYQEDPSSSSTSWTLIYHNPFFYSKPLLPQRPQMERVEISLKKDTVIDAMRMEIEELKAALDHQRRARRKSEHLNKRLVKELNKERRRRDALERVCEELTKEMSSDRAMAAKMRKDMEEERRMLGMAEALREERVQMKLAEAKIFLEEKMSQQFAGKQAAPASMTVAESASAREGGAKWKPRRPPATCNDVVDNKSSRNKNSKSVLLATRKEVAMAAAAEESERREAVPENPHIKRGIKGFVEFPRVVRAAGSKSCSRHKLLECHKAQIRILLKQQSPPLRSDHLIWTK